MTGNRLGDAGCEFTSHLLYGRCETAQDFDIERVMAVARRIRRVEPQVRQRDAHTIGLERRRKLVGSLPDSVRAGRYHGLMPFGVEKIQRALQHRGIRRRIVRCDCNASYARAHTARGR